MGSFNGTSSDLQLSPAMAQSLSTHPVFQNLAIDFPPSRSPASLWRLPLNLISYDGCGRLFLWNSSLRVLHSVDIDFSNPLQQSQGTLLAKPHSRTWRPDMDIGFSVRYITFNRRGWSVLLAGDDGIMVVDLTSQLSGLSALQETSTYNVRATVVGEAKFYSSRKALRILQVSWHPYSDTHIGVLSSDGVLRLFDLSLDAENPEQEYYLQSKLLDRSTTPIYARPVSFAFGGEHLWDRFSVLILFSNGFIYTICPIAPFGSLHNSSTIEELYRDACQWSSSNADSKAVANASLAAAWLEAVFPSLISQSGSSNCLVLKALAHVPFNASLLLQGPLPVIKGGDLSSNRRNNISNLSSPALMLMYNTAGKDSILAVSLRDGQMQLYALADEVQPSWNDRAPPRVHYSSEGNLVSVGMLVETCSDPSSSEETSVKDDTRKDGGMLGEEDAVWTSQLPPLLQLAVVDFALPAPVLESAPLSLLADPVVPERLYCCHGAGIDAIRLQWLPFSEQSADRSSTAKPPLVYPILDAFSGGTSVPLPLLGVAEILDSFGEMWLVAVTASCKCAVIEMKTHTALDPLHVDGHKDSSQETEKAGVGVLQVISKDLLNGPKDIPIPHLPSSSRPLTMDSVEGRSFLHDHCKLLHEKYIEYAHRVHVELTSHGVRLQSVVQEQQTKLSQAQNKIKEVFQRSESLTSRLRAAFQRNKLLKDQVRKHRALLAVKQKPLTATEQEYRSLLDDMRLQDLDILHSVVDGLKERFERHLQVSQTLNQQPSNYRMSVNEKAAIPDGQMIRLKVAVNQLTQMVEGAIKQVNKIDEMVKKHELHSNH